MADTRKIVINQSYGGFYPSDKAAVQWARYSGHRFSLIKQQRSSGYSFLWVDINGHTKSRMDIPRDCPHLIRVIEEMGQEINTRCSNLGIVEIPSDVDWEIQEYDGIEWVAEKHRTWR